MALRDRPAPLLSLPGALLALALAFVLAWPMVAAGGYLIFDDTASYISGGERVWNFAAATLSELLGQGAPAAEGAGEDLAAGALLNERGEVAVVRSFTYSLYTRLAGAAVWPAGFALLQAAATLWMFFALIGPAEARRPVLLAGGFLAVAAVTTLPWFSAYLMPDIWAAVLVLFAAILIRRFDELGTGAQVALTLLAIFAGLAHYGNVPLALGVLGPVLLWRLLARRLTWRALVAGLLPVVVAPMVNLAASLVILDVPSTTPLRLPILLARSIDDGPARWYLQEACPEAGYAMCEVYGDAIPRAHEFLWGESGIDAMTAEQLERTRAEEFEVLARAFLRYPLEQTASLFGNAALQVVEVGTEQITIARRMPDGELAPVAPEARGPAVVLAFAPVTVAGTLAGAAVLLLLLLARRLTRAEGEVVAVVVLGLLVNAAVFGGLSAPAERYQSRVVWLVPALAALFLVRRLAGAPAGGGR